MQRKKDESIIFSKFHFLSPLSNTINPTLESKDLILKDSCVGRGSKVYKKKKKKEKNHDEPEVRKMILFGCLSIRCMTLGKEGISVSDLDFLHEKPGYCPYLSS